MAHTILADHVFECVGNHFLAEVPLSPCGILALIPVSQDPLGGDTGNCQGDLAIGTNGVLSEPAMAVLGPV